MKNWQKRASLLVVSFVVFAVACIVALKVFNENIIFFLSPTELRANSQLDYSKEFRIGGIVKAGSIRQIRVGEWQFVITDMVHEVMVRYNGSTPALFQEGQGVIACGTLHRNGEFVATELLAKHDENYMPKEVADALKKSGYWKEPNGGEKAPDYADPDKPPYDVYGK